MMIKTAQEARAHFDIVFVPPDFAASNISSLAPTSVIDNSAGNISRKEQGENNISALHAKRTETCPDRNRKKGNGDNEQQVANPQKKRVRFACDPNMNGKVKCEYFGDNIPPLDISPRQTNPIWYCPTEFNLFKKDGKRVIGRHGGKAECQKEYLFLYRRCASPEEMRKIRLPQSAAFCASQTRGLEKLLFSQCVFSGIVVRSVLEEQKELMRAGVKNPAFPLARFCMSQSAPARRMARVLGAGDENVARDDSDLSSGDIQRM